MKLTCIFFSFLALAVSAPAAPPDFAAVYRLFDERCLECHAKDDYEGGLVMEDHAALLKGGESGAAVVPGKSGESLLVKYLLGQVEKDGKRRFMPPGKREKLSDDEVKLVREWIDAGAKPSTTLVKMTRELTVPKVAPKTAPRLAVNALAFEPKRGLLAIGRYGVVEIVVAASRQVERVLPGHHGTVNALVFSADGTQLYAASGENALFGEVKQWNLADGKLARTFEGHRDTIYALALSPDGKTLATGSYDQQIKLWDTSTGAEVRTLRGHNGGVFALAFRPDGKLLASASADRTVKLWDAATGQRRDTLSQPTKEQVALAWSEDGKRLVAGGFDNRLRVWEVTPDAKESTNPLLVARFAHEGPVMRIVWSADGQTLLSSGQDGTVKLWDPATIREKLVLEPQPDWPSALAFTGKTVIAGRLDGSVEYYDPANGQKMPATMAAAAPALKAVEPSIAQRGTELVVKITGTDLGGVRGLTAAGGKIAAELDGATSPKELRVKLRIPAELPRGAYSLALPGAMAMGASVPFFVDDLPQVAEGASNGPVVLPATVSGTLSAPGETDSVAFAAKAGETLVFDLAAKAIGSKADATISLVDETGRVLASNNDFDSTGDPFLAWKFAKSGTYRVLIRDQELGGSPQHTWRLSMGALPYVTACFPFSIAAHRETDVRLIGFNLGPDATVKLAAGDAGEMPVPVPRGRGSLKVAVTDLPHASEIEPNDTPAQTRAVPVPAVLAGTLGKENDIDLWRFHATKGSAWAIETEAARRGSPADTKIEVLDAAGKPVERLLLQAVRDSAINFRAIDSAALDVRVDNWREMALNQFMYLGGEVAKIFRMPEGPDSGFQFYATNGKRTGYYNTTPTAHSIDEPCYIIEPHPPGTKLIGNGLPVFTLYYANDDDGDRALGTDSRLLFTAPADGDYLVRVTDSRGLGGERFGYDLVIREPQPDFAVRLTGQNPQVSEESGQPFSLTAERKDGFEGEIRIEIANLPAGWMATTPLIIQAGHQETKGTLHALAGAKTPGDAEAAKVQITAVATIGGREVRHELGGFGKMAVAKAPQLFVALEPAAPGDTVQKLSAPTPMQAQDPSRPLELTIAPGESIPAWVKIRRNGHKAEVRFDVENLPHGVVVDNLGLNGITLLADQNEGEIAIKCDRWVEDMDRLCYAVTRGLGTQTSLPVVLHVRKKPDAKLTAN